MLHMQSNVLHVARMSQQPYATLLSGHQTCLATRQAHPLPVLQLLCAECHLQQNTPTDERKEDTMSTLCSDR